MSNTQTFTDALLINPPSVLDEAKAAQSERIGHNRAIIDWQKYRMGAMNGLQPAEYAVLDYLYGFNSWIDVHGVDGLTLPNVVEPVVQAFGTMLNYDLGRLRGERLSEYVSDLITAHGVDPDTLDWSSEAKATDEALSDESEARLGADWTGETVSAGTMKASDLVPSFLSVLETVKPALATAISAEYAQIDEPDNDERADNILSDLFDDLDAIAPSGCTFSAQDGDGACYGFWLQADGSMCIDCLTYWANAETDSALSEADEQAWLAKYRAGNSDGTWVPMVEFGDTGYFSWKPCDSCKSELGGQRYDATWVSK